jgi:hypothetical protein
MIHWLTAAKSHPTPAEHTFDAMSSDYQRLFAVTFESA